VIAEEVSDLREDWMPDADRALANRCGRVRRPGEAASPVLQPRPARRPGGMVLRLLILKHLRNWSYDVLERELRANLVCRDFTRVGGGKTPDVKTMGRWGVARGPEVL
jgi:IS5 family transposase